MYIGIFTDTMLGYRKKAPDRLTRVYEAFLLAASSFFSSQAATVSAHYAMPRASVLIFASVLEAWFPPHRMALWSLNSFSLGKK